MHGRNMFARARAQPRQCRPVAHESGREYTVQNEIFNHEQPAESCTFSLAIIVSEYNGAALY
jgi:hypothetical protein